MTDPGAGIAAGGRPSGMDELRRYWRRAAENGLPWPSEPALALELGVSRAALREGLVRLEAEGLIRRRHGDATYVNRPAADIPVRFDTQMQYDLMLERAGLPARAEQLSVERAPLTAEQATPLGVAEGSPALRTVKRWWVESTVAMVASNVIPLVRSDGSPLALPEAEAFAGITRLFPLIERLRGEVVEWEIATPGAAVADVTETAWFDGAPPAAILTLDLRGVTRRGEVAYLGRELHRPGILPHGFVRSVRN